MLKALGRLPCRSLFGLALAVILSAVPVVSSSFGQSAAPVAPSGPPAPPVGGEGAPSPAVAPGVALGDCVDSGFAMARNHTLARRPSNPAEKVCEAGRIRMQVQADRHFGYRIMDPVRVTVLLSVDPQVVFDMQSLSRGSLTFNGQEFDLVSQLALEPGVLPVTVQAQRTQDGRNLIKIELVVQSAVPASQAPYLVFRLDLRYALGNVRDAAGNVTAAPDWRVLSTPLIGLTMSQTAVAGDPFIAGEVEPVGHVLPWPTFGLLVCGIVLVLFWPGLRLVKWINRVRPGRKIPGNERAWSALDRIFAEGRRSGFSHAHFKGIAQALRQYLKLPAATLHEMRAALETHPRRREILRVINRCEAVLYCEEHLNDEEMDELIEDVGLIVPRPR